MSTTAHISDAQLNANRQNAALSTGPRSEEAKQRTRLNGLRHGLTSPTIVMPYEDQQVYEDFFAATIADLQPADDTERGLALSIASETWRLNCSRSIEGNIFAIDITAEDEDTDQSSTPLLPKPKPSSTTPAISHCYLSMQAASLAAQTKPAPHERGERNEGEQNELDN